jgi:hypothetical protein
MPLVTCRNRKAAVQLAALDKTESALSKTASSSGNTVFWFKLTSTRLSGQSGGRNADAANLDRSKVVCLAAAVDAGQGISLKKCPSIPNITNALHVMQPSTCAEPPRSKHASFKNNATQLVTFHCQQTPIYAATTTTAWIAKV